MIEPNWTGILWEARGYLDLGDSEPVPVDEVVAQAEANGYSEREARKALQETDKLEHADTDSGGMYVQLAGPAAPGESSGEDTETEDETPGSEAEESPEDDDYHVEIPEDRIADHYDRVRGVYERLASVGDYPTMGLDDLAGWYITRDEHDAQRLADGYDKRRRPAAFEKDLDTVLARVDRTIYGLTTYKSPEAFARWTPARLNDANQYEYAGGNNPTPEITDLRAVCAWGDIDLRDELKPQRGDLDDETKATAEATLEAYAEEFGKLVGGSDAVYGLDSVGGAYLFTAPEASVEIAEHVAAEHGEEWAGRVLNELITRSNEWLKDAQERVEERVDGASDVIDPDWANNHNRKYKAPLSIHKDHDAVVTPIDTDDVDYSITRLEAVDDDLVAEGEAWADRFTADEYADRVGHLVAELFDTEPSAWREAIDEWVETEREKAEKREELRSQTRQHDREEEVDLSGFDITPRISKVEAAIDDLDITSVAGDTIVKHWTEDKTELTDRSGSGKKAIVPTWAGSYESGNATYVDTEKGIFNDTADGDHGTAVEMALLNADNVAWRRGEIANGRDWARGVQCLREMGYNIPVWTPDAPAVNGEKMPYWALRSAALALGVVEDDDLVERDSDTGEVLEDGDDAEDTYLAFPPGTYADAIAAVEDAGLKTGREPPATSDTDEHTETPRDILGLDVVVEPAHALTAAAAVEPDDLDTPLPELEREAVDDVAVAVAIAEDMIADASEFPTDGDYTEAYYRARDHYGAPLPKYLDNSTLEERADLCIAAVKRVEPKHILDAVDSEITVEEPSGKATAKLNPTWEESDSGERIVVGYGRGFYCVEHQTSFSPIQLVALEHGYIDTEDEYPRGEAFKQSYRLLREEYGAPLPKWRATLLEHVAVLPPSVRVLQGSAIDKDLDEVYAETEALLRDALSVRDRAQLVTVAPNGGKTFSSAKISDDRPELYTAERNDLKQQMARYAAEIREDDDMDAEPTTQHLPILAEKTVDDAVLREATGEIREHGRRLLRDREELLDRVGGYLGEEFDEGEDGGEDDEVDLDRASCPVATGEHGEAWALAVQTARSLGHEPSKIHQYDTALFGETLPCQEGTAECPYTEAWDRIRQPENQADILIGSPGHAYVDSATTYFDTDENGDRVEKPRSVVVDEFIGEAYMNDYGERSVDHAVWIAEALVGVDNREDLLAAGLDTDTWVDCWLDGDGEEYHDAGEITDLLEAGAAICEAAENAANILEDGLDVAGSSVNVADLRGALEALTTDEADLGDIEATLTKAIAQLGEDADREYATGDPGNAGRLYDLLDNLENIHEGVTRAVGVSGGRPLEAQLRDAVENFRAGGDLRALLLEAADAIADGEPVGLIHAARTALRGGREGCRELAVFADDGYAHPDAWALLAGVIATDTAEVDTATFAFDGGDGGVFKRLERNGATIIADKNHHGAIVVDPPAFTDITGGKCPLVGLDATARPELWRLALGRDTERRDIHDSPAERRRFLREVMNLRVIQTSNDPLPYHGDPEGKNFGEDIELVRTVAEKYTGDHADAVDKEDPAVISTLKVINHLKESLEGDTSDLINYENMKGSDALGDRQVAVVLGSCHYGDAKPEKWGLLAGEDAGRGDSRGDRLDYGSEVANTYLAHMREDYTMQAILRAGRNDEESVVFAHTSALRDDLPVEDEAAVLSVHSKGTLAVAEAASEFTGRAFTAPEIADELGDDGIGLRQVQNVLADLRENGYLRVENDGGRGNAFEYHLEEDPGLAEVDLPGGDSTTDSENEIPRTKSLHRWNFVFDRDNSADSGVIPPSTPEIPATDATDTPADGVEPPS